MRGGVGAGLCSWPENRDGPLSNVKACHVLQVPRRDSRTSLALPQHSAQQFLRACPRAVPVHKKTQLKSCANKTVQWSKQRHKDILTKLVARDDKAKCARREKTRADQEDS
eukprot:1134211-Amphidinium_carterae.1